MCGHKREGAYATVHMWKSKDNFREKVLSLHLYMSSTDQTLVNGSNTDLTLVTLVTNPFTNELYHWLTTILFYMNQRH